MSEAAEQRRERLVEVYNVASVCEKCPLSKTRTRVVFGSGNANADLMFVGEAPGAEEDRQGLPFVGRAGGLLTRMLEEMGSAARRSSSPTSSNAGRQATAIRSRSRSSPVSPIWRSRCG